MMPEGITDGYIELYSGSRFTPGSRGHQWKVEDIAHSLGNQCRYTGHCRNFYSVAEHSVLCSLLAEETGLCDPFEALMHDAHESVISDMAAPWKPHLPEFSEAEQKCAEDLRAHFGLPLQTTPGCKRVDYLALFIEARFLIHSKGEGWVDPLNLRPEALKLVERGWHPGCLEPAQAKQAFLRAFHELETVPAGV